jgi:hypothetical protein
MYIAMFVFLNQFSMSIGFLTVVFVAVVTASATPLDIEAGTCVVEEDAWRCSWTGISAFRTTFSM